MKVRTLAVAAGVIAPLILGGSASGGFTGISTTSKPNEFGLFVVNVYAIFDRPGEDHMLVVAGTPNSPLQIDVIGGTFFQNPFGTDRAPVGALISVFPSLAFDTFVTIGVKQVGPSDDGNPGQPMNNLTLADWPGFGDSVLTTSTGGWVITPANPQGNPFDPANSFPGDGRVLIGQFSTLDGSAIQGTMLLQYISNGVNELSVVSFQHMLDPPCPWDCGGDDDGNVGIVDFLALLAQWGTLGSCNIDGDGSGVGINDFLALLANWGSCP